MYSHLKLLFFFISILLFNISCSKKDRNNNHKKYKMLTQKEIKNLNLNLNKQQSNKSTKIEKIKSISMPKEFKNLDLNFPNTTCGRLVKKYLDCELKRLAHSTIKGVSKDKLEAFRKSMMSYKIKKFSEKKEKFISHCEKITLQVPKQKIEECMKKQCRLMDDCLKELAKKYKIASPKKLQ